MRWPKICGGSVMRSRFVKCVQHAALRQKTFSYFGCIYQNLWCLCVCGGGTVRNDLMFELGCLKIPA